jgi:hypothetical protein
MVITLPEQEVMLLEKEAEFFCKGWVINPKEVRCRLGRVADGNSERLQKLPVTVAKAIVKVASAVWKSCLKPPGKTGEIAYLEMP